ncbi:TetR/AcrR family transcriptional regulator C-terminal domain-containing protein [Nocardia sp. CDC153]|uniref:TetR/AcrR family transcriptional regulator n=1 Tax=Nocardia sp. CDC153 TaxID=3112167 RepID=UPI002DBCA8A9|nr:TetR/AcrR family transcriptional regulator C-terminal domain-containing protein [Nocardia sp. CDC153]MEC3955612.1 TetR/AcrR family transcriptional regulator C-terminal domain-containing protein [Nocardia sp. CDC153]
MAAKTQEFSSVWTRPERPRREQPALSREQIVAEALALLDTEGYDALSMRKLGTRLNAGATSLYTHVTNKDEILELAIDEAFRDVRTPDSDAPENWRDEMVRLGSAVRAAILSHPWISIAMTGAGLAYLGPNLLRISNALLGLLAAAGFDDRAADRGANVFWSYVLGATSGETAMLTTIARSGMDEKEWFAQFMATAEQATQPYPHIARRYDVYRSLDPTQSREDFFEDELRLIVDGLEPRRIGGTGK